MHAPSEEKSDESKDSFYEELERFFYHFPKYHMKILLGDFNTKVGRENIFKPTIGNESLHQDSKYCNISSSGISSRGEGSARFLQKDIVPLVIQM